MSKQHNIVQDDFGYAVWILESTPNGRKVTIQTRERSGRQIMHAKSPDQSELYFVDAFGCYGRGFGALLSINLPARSLWRLGIPKEAAIVAAASAQEKTTVEQKPSLPLAKSGNIPANS